MGWNHQPVIEGRAVVCVEIRDEETPDGKADSELGYHHSSGQPAVKLQGNLKPLPSGLFGWPYKWG